jgi:methylphosphotriester-DNA--protein-cysteine methyltransferase
MQAPIASRSAPVGYAEWPPPPALAWAIECVWTRRSDGGPTRHSRVLPDGCADLVFDLSERPALAGGEAAGLRAIAVGTMTRPLLTEVRPDSTLVGVRLRPGAGLPFVGAPLETVTDRSADLAALWRPAAVERLLERLATTERPGDWVRAIAAEIAPRGACVPDGAVRAAVRWIVESQGRVRAGELADRLGLSRQTLARRFRLQVGVGPKMLARVLRMRATVARIDKAPDVDWATLALDQGFADQAHLCAELRDLAGAPPTRLRRERRASTAPAELDGTDFGDSFEDDGFEDHGFDPDRFDDAGDAQDGDRAPFLQDATSRSRVA